MTINKQFVSKFNGKSNNGIPTFTQLRASERALERAQKVGFLFLGKNLVDEGLKIVM